MHTCQRHLLCLVNQDVFTTCRVQRRGAVQHGERGGTGGSQAARGAHRHRGPGVCAGDVFRVQGVHITGPALPAALNCPQRCTARNTIQRSTARNVAQRMLWHSIPSAADARRPAQLRLQCWTLQPSRVSPPPLQTSCAAGMSCKAGNCVVCFAVTILRSIHSTSADSDVQDKIMTGTERRSMVQLAA